MEQKKQDKKRGFLGCLLAALWGVVKFFCRCCRRFASFYVGLYRHKPWWVKLLWVILTLVFLVIFYVFAVMVNLFWLFGKSPSAYDIMHPRTPEASVILSADSVELGKFFDENRQSVSYDSIAPAFFQALVATEDERFFDHHGIDFPGLLSAAKDALGGRARGASTISQQLVKNMFRIRTSQKYSTGLVGKIPGCNILVMKTKEMVIAVELEMRYEKDSMLNMYANTVDFGSNAFGIKTAAKTYFDKRPSQLAVEEAAVLVGLLKATSTYNPRLHPEQSLRRRNVVLDNMYRHRDYLERHFGRAAIRTQAELDSLKALPITLHFNVESAYDGQALYFRRPLADFIRQHCPDLDVYTDGLKIYTTLDSRMQRYAEQAVRDQMKEVQQSFDQHWRGLGEPWRDEHGQPIAGFIESIARTTPHFKQLEARFPSQPDSVWAHMNLPHPVHLFDYDSCHVENISTMDSIRRMVSFLHAGFVAMEPATGAVRAYVGDIDFDTWKYDKVQAMRQPGSTFKLFVYATAMEQGWTPADARLSDSYIRREVVDANGNTTIWQPHNADGHFTNAHLPLRSAFAASVNTIAVKLGEEVGVDNVARTAHAMGIKSPLSPVLSLSLGSNDVNLFELVNAYATVANDGVHVEPMLVERIVDRDGRVVYEADPQQSRALTRRSAFYMQKLLEAGVRDGGGTSQTLGAQRYLGAFNGRLDFGGKTGTSNNHSDAWFVGVTPSLVGGAWVGGEYRSIHFRTGRLGQGSRTALPIFGRFMRQVLDDPALAPRYMKRYGLPPEDISPDTYQVRYTPRPAKPDSFVVDSAMLYGAGLEDFGLDSPVPEGEAALE